MTMIKRMMVAAGLLAFGATAPAMAADNAMQVCGAKYQADKKAGKVPAGQTWNQYLAACRGGMKSAAATTPAPAARPATVTRTTTTSTTAKAPSANQLAARDRQKQCGQMWKADKAAGKIPAGQTWPKYWSQCNTKLKG
jgi:hypothetical protein